MYTLDTLTAEIIDTVGGEFYTPMNDAELMVIMGIENGEKELFYEALKALLMSGEIVATKRGKLIPAEDSGFLTGVFRATTRGFGFVTRDGGDVFIPRDASCFAMNGDRVMYKLTRKASDGENPE